MKENSLRFIYQLICATFCTIVILSNIISVKMVTLPWIGLVLPAGMLTYPLTFLLSDLITEIYGAKEAKQMVYIAFGMNLLSFAIISFALFIPASDASSEAAFQAVMGLSGLRIFSSLAAYLISQLVDIQLYSLLKRLTGERFLWVRNNGSTCASQIVDTVVVDILFLYWGLGMELLPVFSIMLISYLYKAAFSVVTTPLFYLGVYLLRRKPAPTTAF